MPRPSLRHVLSRNPEGFAFAVVFVVIAAMCKPRSRGFAVGFVFEFACHCGMLLAAIQKFLPLQLFLSSLRHVLSRNPEGFAFYLCLSVLICGCF